MMLDLSSGQRTWQATADGFVGTVEFSPNGQFLAAAGGGTLHVFDVASGRVIRSGRESARSVAFSPDGRRLAVLSDNVNMLAVGTWTSEASLEAGHPQTQVAFAQDNSRLASTGSDGIVHVWHLGERREAARFSLGVPSIPMWLSFSPDGRTLASGWSDKTARVLDATSAIERWRVTHEGFVLAGAFTPNGRYLITGGDDGVARVSEVPDGGTVALLGPPDLSVPLVVSPDGRHVAAVRQDGVLRLTDRETGAPLLETAVGGQTTALKFMPDGRRVLLAVKDRGIRLLDAGAGGILWQVPMRGQVDGVAVSPHGTSVAIGSWAGELIMLDAQSGASIWTANAGGRLLGVTFSGNGRRVAAAGAYTRVLDAATGAVVWRRDISTFAAALSDDGTLLALALADQSVRVYRLESDKEIFRVTMQGTVFALSFSHDASSLAVGGSDHNARVFDLASGSERTRIPHDDPVYELGFTPDRRLWTNQGFNVVRWHAVAANMLAVEACTKLSRSLTPDEWARYLGDKPYRAQCDARR